MKINAIQNHWISANDIIVIRTHRSFPYYDYDVIGHPQRRRLSFVPLVWSCFWYAPAFFQLAKLFPGRSKFYTFHFFFSTFYCKSTSTKECKCYYKVGQLFRITKRGKWYYKVGLILPSGTIFVTKWGSNYKVMQYRRQMKETGEMDLGNGLLHSPIFCLATDTLPLGILEKLKFCNNKKGRNHKPLHRRISVTCNLEKHLFRVVSCI